MNKLAEIFKPTLSFIGSFDKLPPTANLGDVCVVDGKEYIYAVDWQELACITSTYDRDVVKIENETLYLTEC